MNMYKIGRNVVFYSVVIGLSIGIIGCWRLAFEKVDIIAAGLVFIGAIIAITGSLIVPSSVLTESPDVVEKIDNLPPRELLDELLFLLSDIMHNRRIFEILTNDEINRLFIEARMCTKTYNERVTAVRVEDFIQRLRDTVLPKLYPNFYKGEEPNENKD